MVVLLCRLTPFTSSWFYVFLSLFVPFAGSDAVVEVIITAFQRLCENTEPKELDLMWKCLYEKITECVTNGCILHLSRLLSLLISVVQIHNGQRVYGKP